jgi:hypothetical protein
MCAEHQASKHHGGLASRYESDVTNTTEKNDDPRTCLNMSRGRVNELNHRQQSE